MVQVYDFLVIGGGIAGASAAAELSAHGQVLLLEQEDVFGYHTTGRSAAMYTETYGNRIIRAITAASREFFLSPPSGFTETDLVKPRGSLLIFRADQLQTAEKQLPDLKDVTPNVRIVDATRAQGLFPILDPDYIEGGIYDDGAMDIDVNALHQGYLRWLKRRGGDQLTAAEVFEITREGKFWRVRTRAGDYKAPIVVNAAGAWGDEVAARANVAKVGLTPMRRTAFTFRAPAGHDPARWAICIDIDETFYVKPEAGLLLGSPADETPMPPCDVQPEELDIALAADRIEKATLMQIRRIERKWAGLRTFAPDRTPVLGEDPDAPGFFWCVGQGGYGMQTAPGMARSTAALVLDGRLPEHIRERGVGEADLSPQRFRINA